MPLNNKLNPPFQEREKEMSQKENVLPKTLRFKPWSGKDILFEDETNMIHEEI